MAALFFASGGLTTPAIILAQQDLRWLWLLVPAAMSIIGAVIMEEAGR